MMTIDPTRPNAPASPRDSATVVVLRQAERAVEVFCVERHIRSGVLGGAIVFPGGKVDEADFDEHWGELALPLEARSRAFDPDERRARAFAVAALRELLEEAAILPVAAEPPFLHEHALELRSALLHEGPAPSSEARAFGSLLGTRGLRLGTDRVRALWRWITPAAEIRRYDTRFYLLALPEGQQGEHDQRETTHSFWATPDQTLERWRAGEITLAPPTLCTLELFKDAQSLAEAFAIAERQTLDPICPHALLHEGETVIAMPGDPLYPEPRPPPSDPSAPTRFVLRDGRFVGQRMA